METRYEQSKRRHDDVNEHIPGARYFGLFERGPPVCWARWENNV